MEKCQHVSKIRPAWDHSILNPQKWMCYVCRTTESVWACLSCSNVACGRFNEKHALDHYLESKHPISIEVNEKYIYCYVCDDYVMNDNAAGDLKLLRSALSAIATQKFTDIESRGRRLLRSYSHTGIIQRDNTDEDDKLATAAWHQRQRLLAKVFGAWRLVIQQKKMLKKRTPRKQVEESVTPTRSVLKKRTIIPGVTGLRNLGNSCYMNSVLQVLSHIEAFRDFFLKMKYGLDVSPNGSPQVSNVVTATTPSTSTSSASSASSTPSSSSTQSSAMRAKLIQRQTTVDCFQHLMTGKSPYVTPKRRSGGLNGGSNQVSPARQQLICEVESTKSTSENISLCAELHGLFRVLWSGKWAQVSPHAFLRAVWKAIPMFKGYAQHDAKEFICELLDKSQRELDSIPKALRQADSKFLTDLFQGQLVSQVTCLACGNVSETYEPYLDLSLEFPDRYQITKQNPRIAQDICHITEMLAKFTEEEQLEGKIYSCEKCNKNRNKSSGKIYTEAKKQLLINRLPPFLRLHLKRFRWSGRNHREKISTHVAADEHLDLKPFCSDNSNQTTHTYHLFGVIIHHGKGFSSGHYTAYTWNCEADSWVNCNDSRMILSPLEEVLTAQAYILFYRVVNVEPEKFFSSLLSQDSNTSAETLPYSLESEDTLMIDGEDSEKSHRQSRSLSKSKLKSGKIESALSSSFKADGTEMFVSLDQLEGDESMTSEASVQVVDEEISFNFKSPSLEEIENQTIEKGVKRSLTCTGKEAEHHDTKRKRLSFEAGMFYTKTPEKTVPVKDSSCKSELSSNSVFPSKFVKDLPQSCTHVKRRKSAFW